MQLVVGMRAHWLIVSLSLSTTLLGCAASGDPDDKAPGQWTPGKGDGSFELIEAGPASLNQKQTVELDGRVPAYRIVSYGGTTLDIDLAGRGSPTAAADGYLILEGPLDRDGDGIAVGGGTVIAEDDDGGPGRDAQISIKLDQPGTYRLLAGTYESLGLGEAATGTLDLDVACSAACTRPAVDQKTFIRSLQQTTGGAFAELAKQQIAKLIPDQAMAAQLGAQLDQILADPDLTGLERFPTIPLSAISTVRPALGGLNAEEPKPDQVVTGDLMQLLGDCKPDRSPPAEIDPRLPGVRYGHFPSTALAPCQFAHAKTLAQVLTSLAANNGSEVTYKGKTLRSPRDLFAALVESGHTIEVRNEAMYANFLSLIVGDRDLRWPVWLDTGIPLSSGETLTIPVGHSGHAWRISGPNVNTRVMFYLGISGTAFFGQTSDRPAWTGNVALSDVTVSEASGADYDYLLATADTAAKYLQRSRTERSTLAQGMPADGYGYLGVCNDSTATLEYATRGTISEFPLLRAKELDQAAPDLNDGLDDVVRALPKDGDGIVDPHDALRRAVLMQPFADGSPMWWDDHLAAQVATARRDLGE